MLRSHFYVLVALVIGTTSVATAEDYIAPTGVTILTEKQLLSQIVGNTFVGGTTWVEYYEPAASGLKEGRIKGKQRSKAYGGTWTVQGALMCWKFDNAKWAVYNDCFTIALDGNNVNSYTIRGKVHTDVSGHITLKPGNPNSL